MRQRVEVQTLARIIRRNTAIDLEIQSDVFRVFTSVVSLSGGCGDAGSPAPIGNLNFALELDGAAFDAMTAIASFALAGSATTFACCLCHILTPELEPLVLKRRK